MSANHVSAGIVQDNLASQLTIGTTHQNPAKWVFSAKPTLRDSVINAILGDSIQLIVRGSTRG
jgi:hypothetical protein